MTLLKVHLIAAAMLATLVSAVETTSAQVRVTGRVVNDLGIGVSGVDLDFGIPIPGSSSGIGGVFDVMVPAGTYDIGFRPPSAQLAPRMILSVPINFEINLGAIALEPGFAVTGRTVRRNGAPIAGANVDVLDANGELVYTPNDGSDLAGNFQVVLPSGAFDFRVHPPTASGLVPLEFPGLEVSSSTPLGNIVLPPGFPVTGRVIHSQTLLPLLNADVDVEDALTGLKVYTPADNSDATGVFNLLLPTGLYHLTIDPPIGQPLIGRERFNVLVLGAVNLGDLAMEPGFLLSGTVLGANFQPVVGADIDVVRAPDGNRVYTPFDKTGVAGTYTVVVPAGNYRVRVQPPFELGLVGVEIPVVVNANTALPTTNLAPGFVLSGTLTSPFGLPEVGADIDIINPATGEELVLTADDTDATGHYQIVVPFGTWRVGIDTGKLSPSRAELLLGVHVPGPKVLDHMLELVPVITYLETFGVPSVPPGGLLVVNFAVMNVLPSPQDTLVSLVLIDPDGIETTLLPRTLLNLPGQVPLVSQGLALPVPPVNPLHRGHAFRLEVRFADPVTHLEYDRDNIKFIVR